MSLYIPKMSDTPGVTIPGLASNFNALADSRIVEQGSNENGEYWRWENGLQVCLHRLTLTKSADTRMTGTWDYPSTFAHTPYIGRMIETNPVFFMSSTAETEARRSISGDYLYLYQGEVSARRAQISIFITAGSTLTFTDGSTANVQTFAIGRWK